MNKNQILWLINKLKELSFKEGESKHQRDLSFIKKLSSSRDDNNFYLEVKNQTKDIYLQLIKEINKLK